LKGLVGAALLAAGAVASAPALPDERRCLPGSPAEGVRGVGGAMV
jgi:hypothetical protein